MLHAGALKLKNKLEIEGYTLVPLKIYFVNQCDTRPPKFEFQVNNKGLLHFSYERYLENQIRNNIDLTGTPIILKFTNKGDKE